MDPTNCTPLDAVLAVSRLLAPASGVADAARIRQTVAEQGARLFEVPVALLIGLSDADRSARVLAAHGADAPANPHEVAELGGLDDLVAGRLPRHRIDPATNAALIAALAPEAPVDRHTGGLLVAVGGDVLLLTGADPRDRFGSGEQIGELFVNAAAAALESRRSADLHEEHMTRQLALTRAAKTLNEALDLGQLLGRICEEAMGLLAADNAAVYHGTRDRGFEIGGLAGLPPEYVGWPLQPGTGISGQVVEQGRAMLTNDYPGMVTLTADSPFRHVRSALAVPFGWDDELRGVLSVGWERAHRVTTDELAILETFTELAGIACRNASARATLAKAARTDALTGCLNHAALHEQLERELERAARGAVEPPSLVMIDLDHFKQVNEEHGHLTGDEVLRRVGTALRSGIRPYDVAARYGGDEFALLVTAADEDMALEVAGRAVDRITAAIAEFVDGDVAGATAGVAAWTDGVGPSELVARADRALLRGKQAGGRGRAHPFSEVPRDWHRGRFTRPGDPGPRPPMPPAATYDAAERDERLRERTRRLGLANALAARLAGMTDVEQILGAAVEELHRAFGYFLCAIVRDDGEEVRAVAVRGEAFYRLGLQGWSQPRDIGLIGRCLRTQRPVLARDVAAEPDYDVTPETIEVRSELVVPLRVGDELWGVVNLEELEPEAFDEDDVRLVQTVADQVGGALHSASQYEQLERACLDTALALVAALETGDAAAGERARSFVVRTESLGRRLGMGEAELRDLRFAAVFHDIGEVSIPDAIRTKPGPLTRGEREEVERHTIVGEQILAPAEYLAGVLALVRHAHERWDGAGYPDGLAGEAIPLGSRVIFACDALQAMLSDRPHRGALPLEAALHELRENAGRQFDPRVVEALLAELDESPSRSRLDGAARPH